MRSTPVSRILYGLAAVAIISLGPASPRTSMQRSSFGRAVRGCDPSFERSCFRWGLPEPASPRSSVSSYLTISPLPQKLYEFLGTPSGLTGTPVLRTYAPPACGGAPEILIPFGWGCMFLWHFPSSCPDRTLSCTLPCEARTFLTRAHRQMRRAIARRTSPAQYSRNSNGPSCDEPLLNWWRQGDSNS